MATNFPDFEYSLTLRVSSNFCQLLVDRISLWIVSVNFISHAGLEGSQRVIALFLCLLGFGAIYKKEICLCSSS